MKRRRMVMILAVVAMVMGAMAPASAAKGGVSSASLIAKGYNCDLDNFLADPPGAGVHCAKTDILAFLDAAVPGSTLHVMVFSSPDDGRFDPEAFLGTEILRFPRGGGEVIARHAWHGGFDPTA